jgi:hypothetical protein
MSDSIPAPFFVVGAQRSGTTMLRLMLNAHSRLAVPFESVFIPKFFRRAEQYGDLGERENLARLLEDIRGERHVARGQLIPDVAAILDAAPRSYAELVTTIFSVYASRKGKPRWGDKTPGYGSELDVLSTLFPESKVIHIVRDGRDVALSNRTLSWGIRSMPRAASAWRWETLLTRKLGRMLGGDYLEVRYEDLVRNPEAELRRICTHIGEHYEPDMLQYHRSASDEMPQESLKWHGNSVRPPDNRKVFQWREQLSIADRVIFEDHAGDALEEFGYAREFHPPTIASRARMVVYAALGR